jgi:hypothetical protein
LINLPARHIGGQIEEAIMEAKTITLRGRTLSPSDIEGIRQVISQYWDKGRTYISRVLCQQWDWRQPNGWLKDRACRVMLLRLEERGLIELPPRQATKVNRRRPKTAVLRFDFELASLSGRVDQYDTLQLDMVRRTPREAFWDELMDKYHYLGYDWIVGAYLKYMAFLNGQVVACIGWSSPAWKVRCRDDFIGWSTPERKAHLHLVANNARFLVLPHVRIQNLASKVLSLCARRLSSDWQAFFGHPIVLLETFVNLARFSGTCYKAANWIYLGQTRGSAKRGAAYHHHGQSKAVYVDPLVKNFRAYLCGRNSGSPLRSSTTDPLLAESNLACLSHRQGGADNTNTTPGG